MKNLNQALKDLTGIIGEMVKEAVSNNVAKPEALPFFQWKVINFQYTDQGLVNPSAEGTYFSKRIWLTAINALNEKIKGHETYKDALGTLQKIYPAIPEIPSYLETFTRRITGLCFENSQSPDTDKIERTIKRFIKDLAGEPATCTSKVYLQGVVLRSERIKVGLGAVLRQPTKEDLETAFFATGFHEKFLPTPSAILEIELLANKDQIMERQLKIEQFIVLLRLFNVGSVKWTSYEMDSDAVIDFLGKNMKSGPVVGAALETYLISQEDEIRLKNIWQNLSLAMPRDLYDFQKQVNHLTLAYDRYSDALLQNGIFERRVANAMMGLEALLLDENQELSYRIGLRVSKLFSFLGENPLQVREIVRKAYDIRSKFAHGGHLTYKERKKLESKYGDLKNILLPLLNYLRTSIVVMILSRISKEQFIDLIDDALIEPKKNEDLKNMVSGMNWVL